MNIRWLTFFLLLSLHAPALFAAGSGETKAFKQATQMFADKVWPAAERSLAEFLNRYPNSEFRAEAVLYQARARFNETNVTSAVELLQTELPKAGGLADQYHYWTGVFLLESGKLQEAADKFGELLRNFPQSTRLLEASYNQALAWSKLGQWPRVIELLAKNESAFQQAFTRSTPDDRFANEGVLLLGQAFFSQNNFGEAEKSLSSLDKRALTPEMKWRQQFLLCRSQFAGGQFQKALVTSSNLMQSVTGIAAPRVAESVSLQADIFEKLNRLPEAVQTHEKNLADGLPEGVRRRALSKIIQLSTAQNKSADLFAWLDKFAGQHTNDASLDLALFSLGELQVREFYSAAETPAGLLNSNLITAALTNFDRVLTNFPQSDLLGKVYLNRGWCFWAAENFDGANTNFAEAVTRLPVSEEQAVARFKLADTQFKLHDLSNALSNYEIIFRDFTNTPAVQQSLIDQALYQTVRASLDSGDQARAKEAMHTILTSYPTTGFADRARLLVGQELNRKGSFKDARLLFSEFINKATNSSLLPEVKLALAQTYVQERNWPQAIESFEKWIGTFTNHALLPDAEFSRALATFQSGAETNALDLFTNFVARFPSNNLAPVAQNWLGDFYFNHEDFVLAEQNYQLVLKYNPSVELNCQARMGAGRAAFERQGFKEARDYFSKLVSNTTTPTNFLAEAYFALGDTIYSQFLADTNHPADDFRAAVSAFSTITREFPTNALAASAFGRIGECYFQWANLSKEDSADAFSSATNAFTQVLDSSFADVSARSQAQVGLGKIFEGQGNLEAALEHYARVLYVGDGESFDARWVKEAGLAAARLCENREQWEQAVNIYQRLLAVLPSLKSSLDKKILIDRSRSETAKN